MPGSSVPKLGTDDKTRYKTQYNFHCQNLRLYLKLGLIIEIIHRKIQLSQGNGMELIIGLNAEKKETAREKFEEILLKDMNNSAYGKTCRSKEGELN